LDDSDTPDLNNAASTGNTASGTKASKKRERIRSRSLRYPYGMLDSSTDYLKIEIAEYKPPRLSLGNDDGRGIEKTVVNDDNINRNNYFDSTRSGKTSINPDFSLTTGSQSNRNGFFIKNPLQTIYLPIPQQLSDTNSVSWGDSQLTPLEAFGVSQTAKAIEGQGPDIGQLLRDGTNILADPQVQKAVIAAFSGEAVGSIGGNVSGTDLVSRATGQVFNPNLELLFQGVNIRSFPFSFEFSPRNRREGEEVKQIIKSLKKSMSARKNGTTGEIFISAPDVFQLTYMKGNQRHPFLNNFLPMALTSINIVYTGSNTYSTFYDGTPTHMRMDLTFKELNPVYFEDQEALEAAGDKSVGY
jgi:hypothetical protein